MPKVPSNSGLNTIFIGEGQGEAAPPPPGGDQTVFRKDEGPLENKIGGC